MNFEWNYKPQDVNFLRESHSVFIFDNDNKLIKEINLLNRYNVEYIYDDSILKQKRYFHINEKKPYKVQGYTFPKR